VEESVVHRVIEKVYEMVASQEPWLSSVQLKISGLVESEEGSMKRHWILMLGITKFTGMTIVGEHIIEKILCPRSLQNGDFKVIYNPAMEPWLSEEEAIKLKRRLKILMRLPDTMSYEEWEEWRTLESREMIWSSEDIKDIQAVSDDREAELLEIMRRKKIYKKFGL
jgi:hypothetical protein